MITVQVRIVAWVQGDVVIGIGTQGVLSRVAGEVVSLDLVAVTRVIYLITH